jgi:hypothetical protein
VSGKCAAELAAMLNRTECDPALRVAFGWLEFFRDIMLPPPETLHPGGFYEWERAMPAVVCHQDDIEWVESWFGEWTPDVLRQSPDNIRLTGANKIELSVPDPYEQPEQQATTTEPANSECARDGQPQQAEQPQPRHSSIPSATGQREMVPPANIEPDGPFGPDGFRFAGVEVRFGRAILRYRLVLALWEGHRLAPPRTIEEVMTEVYGAEHETEDATFRQLCSDTRAQFQRSNCPLDIRSVQGQVQLIRV